MSFEVQMRDADEVKHFELRRSVEQLDSELARKLIVDDAAVKPTAIEATHPLRSLRLAVESRDSSLVRELLERQPDLNCAEGGRILWLVAEDDDTEIASALVRAGADLTERARGRSFLHALMSSASPRKHRLARLMIERGADVDARDREGRSVLYYAVKRRSTSVVTELLRRNATVDDRAVAYAAWKPKAIEFVPMLVGSFADDDDATRTRDRLAVSAIMCLVTQDNHRDDRRVAVIKALLDIGVDVDLLNTCGWTSLVFAAIFKRVSVVELLLDYGADVRKKSENGVLPLFAASGLEESTIAKMFIDKGANIHDRNDEDRQCPLHAACANASLANIQLLLSLGADVNVVDRSDRTPFSLMDTAESLSNPVKRVVKHLALLVSRGLTVNHLDLSIIYETSHTRNFYELCLRELAKMKVVKVYNDISFFSIFAKNAQELSLLMRNPDFVKSYNTSPRKSLLFPVYFSDMSAAFRNSEKRKNMLVYKENTLNKITNGILPDVVIRKIAYYLYLNDLQSG